MEGGTGSTQPPSPLTFCSHSHYPVLTDGVSCQCTSAALSTTYYRTQRESARDGGGRGRGRERGEGEERGGEEGVGREEGDGEGRERGNSQPSTYEYSEECCLDFSRRILGRIGF